MSDEKPNRTGTAGTRSREVRTLYGSTESSDHFRRVKGKISVPEACRKHGITQGEFRAWADEYHRGGVEALKVNKKGPAAEYRAEVKRLQPKIGELVMENEIRKEAMRPFSSVERTLHGSLLDDDGPKP